MDNKLIVLVLGILLFFYLLQMNHTTLTGYNLNLKNDTNPTNIGFVKPEHRLLKVLNTISAGSKIRLDGKLHAYIYNKNTIDKSVEDRLSAIMKNLIGTINLLTENDYYIKQIENVYGLISRNGNQRYFIDFFIYDTKNFYTVRCISDIVIVDKEIYINYLNVQTGSNPTILNKYDVKFNDTGILFDGNMFKENIDGLFDSFYKNSFEIISVPETSLEYSNVDLTSVVSMNSIRNLYYPSSISPNTVKELEKKDLSGYVEMYLPEQQINIKSPQFCEKYKIEWDSYGIPNLSDNKDKNCYVHDNSMQATINRPINPPGIFNDQRGGANQYDFLMNKPISNSL
tara:strand:+ start:4351 stop:5376 length:1026 start_codon:yes stop_codon:yes gene_type:complete